MKNIYLDRFSMHDITTCDYGVVDQIHRLCGVYARAQLAPYFCPAAHHLNGQVLATGRGTALYVYDAF